MSQSGTSCFGCLEHRDRIHATDNVERWHGRGRQGSKPVSATLRSTGLSCRWWEAMPVMWPRKDLYQKFRPPLQARPSLSHFCPTADNISFSIWPVPYSLYHKIQRLFFKALLATSHNSKYLPLLSKLTVFNLNQNSSGFRVTKTATLEKNPIYKAPLKYNKFRSKTIQHSPLERNSIYWL